MLANISVHERKPPEDLDSPLSFSMEGNPMQPPGALIPFFWSPGWNSIQAVNKFQSEVGGPLAGGDPGALLIEPSHVGANSYSDGTPEAFAPRVGEWLLIPLHHIFGSEELSGQAPAVAELATRPYAALNPDDARGLGVVEGESVEVSVLNVPFQLKVKMAPVLPRGLAGLPLGVPPLIGLTLPTWGKVRKASTLTAETQSTQGKAQ